MDGMDDSDEILAIRSSDSESSSIDDEEEILSEKAQSLELQLSDNKYLYDVHLELVALYRKLGDLHSMRLAYERFHKHFPLTPEIWLSWINDEKKVANSDEEIQHILQLFEKAVEDYLSVNLWVEYVQFAIGLGNVQRTRCIGERAITAVGLHAADGILIWDTLREFEFALLDTSPAEELSDQWKQQIEKKGNIFKRQLSVPLVGMEGTFREWQTFIRALPESHSIQTDIVEKAYRKAWETLATYKPFEEKLLIASSGAQSELVQVYQDYVKALSDPSTILCVFERAAAQLCLLPTIWQDYCFYCLTIGSELAEKVTLKAVRNCPWNETLWAIRLRILEKLERSDQDLLKAFEEGIANLPTSVELWLTYLEQVRRSGDTDKMWKLFKQAQELFQQQAGDEQAKIARLHGRMLAEKGDMAGARRVWTTTVLKDKQRRRSASIWLEFAALEKQYGQPAQVRDVFQRALGSGKSTVDWPQCILEEWTMFERQFGTLDAVLNCMRKHRELEPVLQRQQYDQQQSEMSKKKRKHEGATVSPNEGKKMKTEMAAEESKVGNTSRVVKDPTRTVFVSNLYPSVTEKRLTKFFPNCVNVELVMDRMGKSRCYGYVQFDSEEAVAVALARDRDLLDGRPVFISNCRPDRGERKAASFKYSGDVEENKLFVKGLPLDTTREDLEALYRPFGAVNVRLVVHKSGQSKGLAYIEFPDKDKAKVALEETDQRILGEHTITVAISAPPTKGVPLQAPKGRSSAFEGTLRHARKKLQVPLIPRSLHVKGEAKNGSVSVVAKTEKSDTVTFKSNDDFRRLLLKK